MDLSNIAAPRLIDLFAGAGGFSLGFEQAGYTIVGAIEQDKWACDTFRHNHPRARVLERDITTISDEEIESHFKDRQPAILIGGPPCQGFSIANRKGGDPSDPRNSLFMEFVRVCRVLRPQAVVIENVPNLLRAKTHSGEPVLSVIERTIRELGYVVESQVLKATDFGVPQIRSRLFVVGTLSPLARAFPSPTHRVREAASLFQEDFAACPMLWDAISDLPPLFAGEGAEQMMYSAGPNTDYQRQMRHGSDALRNHKAMNHTKRMVERFQSMKWGDSVNDVPRHLAPRKRNSMELAESSYDQNNRRMNPNVQCHTVPASFYANFVHPYQDRNFTAREGARIQSFPDSFHFLGKPTVVSHKLLARESRLDEKFLCQYNQIGNAVPPLLARAIADNLIGQLEWGVNARTRKQFAAEGGTREKVPG